jgi:II/X family phage/plasmid replication protein
VIDWVSFVAPCSHVEGSAGPLWAGSFISVIPDPELGERIEYEKHKALRVEGSYSNRIMVASCSHPAYPGQQCIYVSGNPAKWCQGHNIFGTDDLPGLVLEMLERLVGLLDLAPTPAERALWSSWLIHLLRVDVTNSWHLGNVGRVRAAIQAMNHGAHLVHRGRGHYRGDSITFGEKSRRWSLTGYAKGPELKVHPLPVSLQDTALPYYADGLLRMEVRMLSMELQREGLHLLANWGDNSASELHARKLEGLTIADFAMLDVHTLEGLPPRLQLAYDAWKGGKDLRQLLPRRTFYRYRQQLLPLGVDIGVRQLVDTPEQSNVIPLRLVLNAQPATVPDWAIGTPLYFEPPIRLRA